MKKLIVSIICMSCSLLASASLSHSDSILSEKIKFAFAIEITNGSVGDKYAKRNPKDINDLVQMLLKDSIDATSKLVSKISKIRIDSVDVNSQTINGKSVDLFVNTEMGKDDFKNYRNKPNRDIKSIQAAVIQAISNELSQQTKIAAKPQEHTETLVTDHRATFRKLGKWLLIIVVISIIGALAYLLLKEKELSSNLETKIDDKNAKITQLQNQLDSYQKKLQLLTNEYNDLEKKLQTSLLEAQERVSQRVEETRIAPEDIAPKEKTYYLGAPAEGEFTAQYESYKQGKTLYRLVTNDEEYGSFEFICQTETINIARNSKTMFLEPACQIENNMPTFTQITTLKKGNVQFINDAWKIINKAVIRLD